MAAAIVTAGDPSSFGFELRWPDERPQEAFSFQGHDPTAADATRGKLIAWVGGRTVWGFQRGRSIKGITWTWIELIEHLTRVWPYIEWEESYPLDLAPITPDTLPALAAQRLTAHPEPVRSEHEQSVWSFRDAHDLAFGLPGLELPSLWIVAQGKEAWVSSAAQSRLLPKEDVLATLSALASAILERANLSSDPRTKAAQNAWKNRA